MWCSYAAWYSFGMLLYWKEAEFKAQSNALVMNSQWRACNVKCVYKLKRFYLVLFCYLYSFLCQYSVCSWFRLPRFWQPIILWTNVWFAVPTLWRWATLCPGEWHLWCRRSTVPTWSAVWRPWVVFALCPILISACDKYLLIFSKCSLPLSVIKYAPQNLIFYKHWRSKIRRTVSNMLIQLSSYLMKLAQCLVDNFAGWGSVVFGAWNLQVCIFTVYCVVKFIILLNTISIACFV